MANHNEQPNLQFITLRPEIDLEVPSDIPISRETFLRNRIETLEEADSWVRDGFDARKQLIAVLIRIGGLDKFRTRWQAQVDKGGGRAASIMARAALVTQRALEERELFDLMTCAYEFGENPQTKKVKWPVLGVIFPDLGSWNLGPDSTSGADLFATIERECPELTGEGDATDDAVVDANSWGLFVQNGRLCTTADDDGGQDMSLPLQVRDVEMSANTLRNGAIRLFAMATFLKTLVEYSMDKCDVCGTTGDQLQLMRCSKCNSAIYCGRECQMKDFDKETGRHRKECKLLRNLRERYSNENPIPEHDCLGAHMALQSFLYTPLRDAVIPTVQERVKHLINERHPEMRNISRTEDVNPEQLVNFM